MSADPWGPRTPDDEMAMTPSELGYHGPQAEEYVLTPSELQAGVGRDWSNDDSGGDPW